MPAESAVYDQSFQYNRSNRVWFPCNSVYATPAAASDLAFKIVGTNAADGDAPPGNGGIVLTTHGGASDSTILAGVSTSIWGTNTAWYAQNYPNFTYIIKTPASLTNTTLWGGLKLTNTATVATDDDQAFFRYAVATSANWYFNISYAGSDTSVDTGVPVAASTLYRFDIQTSPVDGTVQAFINGKSIRNAPFSAMTASTALLPFVGVLSATTATAKTCTVVSVSGSTVA